MNNTEQRKRTGEFIAHWTDKGYEKGESQKFWLELLALLGVESPFLSLRRLENKVLKLLRGTDTQMQLGGDFSPIKVSISQFYGIEINDYAATVAKTAFWIAESQMPPELRKAHQQNDRAVMQAYGFAPTLTEAEIVAELMRMYQALTNS